MAFQDLDPARRSAPRSERSLLWEANTFLARPIAALFGALGIAPGQLSLQSLTVTLVGLLHFLYGDWTHLVEGALIVYGGLLLDRADQILAAEKGSPSGWALFLGLMVDRLVEAGLVIGLAILAAVGVHNAPAGFDSWEFVPRGWAIVLAVAAVSAMLCARLVGAYADLLALRTHLLVIRRLPGPSAIPRRPQGVERLNRIFDRDLLVLVWVVGVMLAQVQLTLAVVLLANLAGLLESVALFWSRRRDPEPQASRILGRDYSP